MIEQAFIEHHIQRSIIGVLIHTKTARFRDLRPRGIDTNLFSYHLKKLIKSGFITKSREGYTLSELGLAYVDRVSIKKLNIRTQPKIITMIVLRNSAGEVLLQRRKKQPYIDTWTVPYGKLHIDDTSVSVAASRELHEKLAMSVELTHAGDCYIRVEGKDGVLSTTLAHIFTAHCEKELLGDDVRWCSPSKRRLLQQAPAVEAIIAATLNEDHFFLELTAAWDS